MQLHRKKGLNNPSNSIGGAIGFRVNRFLGARRSTFNSSLPTTKPLQSTKVNGQYQFDLSAHGRTPEDPKRPRRADHMTKRGQRPRGEWSEGGTETQRSEEGRRETLEWSPQVTFTPTTQVKPCSGWAHAQRHYRRRGLGGGGGVGGANDFTCLIGACSSKYEGCVGRSRNVIHTKIQPN